MKVMAIKTGGSDAKLPGGEPAGASGAGSSPASSTNLMRVTVQVGERRFDEDLAAQAFIAPDLAGIDRALETGPSRFAEWAMLHALARTEHDEIKGQLAVVETDIKEIEALVYLQITDAAMSAGGKAPTIPVIQAMVEVAPRRLEVVKRKQALEADLRAAADRVRVLDVGRETMKDRKDYVIERARDARQEMQSKMVVRTPEELAQFRPGGR